MQTSHILNIERLREVLNYDRLTGVFVWKQQIGKRSKGIAGNVMDDGYRRIGIDGGQYRAHDLAWFIEYGEFPEFIIDHKNRNRDDNSIDNLRKANQSLNLANTGMRLNNKSGYKGASRIKGTEKWLASIKINGKTKYLGTHETPFLAHEAYMRAAMQAWGDFASA